MKVLKRPNVKGPRFRKRSMTVLNKNTYDKFLLKYPEHSNLSLIDFKKIVHTFNGFLKDCVVEHRNGIELPEGLGFIFMGTCQPTKAKNIDFRKSFEYGVEALHKNWDSDNKLMKIFYSNLNTKLPFHNRQVWMFKANKDFRKQASDAYKLNFNKYIEVSPMENISRRFARYQKKEYIQNLKPVVPKNYNEFEI